MISSVVSIANSFYDRPSFIGSQRTLPYSNQIYRSDSFSLSNIVPKDETTPFDPNNPPTEPIPYEPPSFFNRADVRVAGVMLGSGAVGGGIGYAIGSAFGRAGLGAAIGAGIGIAAPIAMVVYALHRWGNK